MIDLTDPAIAEDFTQDTRDAAFYAGAMICVTRPSQPVATIYRRGEPARRVAPEPIPGCPDWVGRCNALFHARLAAFRLSQAS